MGINIETLHELFLEKTRGHRLEFQGPCCLCGKTTKVTVTKTDSGYGFLGGVVHENPTRSYIVECDACFRSQPPVS